MDYSLSDMRAVLGDNNAGFGGGGLLLVVILFLFFVMFRGGWGNNVGIRKTGLYRLTAQLIVAVTAAGTLNVEAYYDGKPLIATRKSLPVPVGSTQIEINNLLYLVAPEGCACADVIYPIDVYAWMSEAGTGSVSEVAVNLLKEA